jgi:hypothetical protein
MIQEKRFGILGGALVRKAWASTLCAENPELFFTYLPEMRGGVLRSALEAVGERLGDREQAGRLWDELSKKDDWMGGEGEVPDNLVAEMGYLVPAEKLLATMEVGREPMASYAAVAMAYQTHNLAFAEQVGKLPENVAGRYALEALKLSDGSAEALEEKIEFLIEGGHWRELADSAVAAKVKELGGLMDPQELAAWVVTFPARAETTEILHRGVEPFIRHDPEAAWEWIGGIEDATWRDRAFAEYSQQSLHRWKDLSKSRAALDQIQDPEFRAVAEKWRSDWTRNNGLAE